MPASRHLLPLTLSLCSSVPCSSPCSRVMMSQSSCRCSADSLRSCCRMSISAWRGNIQNKLIFAQEPEAAIQQRSSREHTMTPVAGADSRASSFGTSARCRGFSGKAGGEPVTPLDITLYLFVAGERSGPSTVSAPASLDLSSSTCGGTPASVSVTAGHPLYSCQIFHLSQIITHGITS